MANCARCGTALGLLSSKCKACEKRKNEALTHWRYAFQQSIADRFLSDEEEHGLKTLQVSLGLTDEDLAAELPALHRAKAVSLALTGRSPAIATTGLFLDQGEWGVFSCAATEYVQVQTQHMVHGSSGFGVRLAPGVTFNTGGATSRVVNNYHTQGVPTTVLLTNYRISTRTHAGISHLGLREIDSYDYFANAIRIFAHGRSRDLAMHEPDVFAAHLHRLKCT